MKNLETFIKKFTDNCGKIKYEQLVLGEKNHPRLSKKKFEIPDYIKGYLGTTFFFEIAYLVKGKCVITMEDSSYILKPGDICILKHGVNHYESYYKKAMGYELVWLFYSNVHSLKVINTVYSNNALNILSSLTLKTKSEIIFLLEDICAVKKPKQQFDVVKTKLEEWFNNLKESIKSKKYIKLVYSDEIRKEKYLKEKRIKKALEYIKIHYKEKIRLKDIAQQASLGRAYFSHLFRKVYNQPLYEFITELRLNDAYSLIRSTGLSINEISYKVGYSNPIYFRRIFKKYTGITPSELRNREISLSPFL